MAAVAVALLVVALSPFRIAGWGEVGIYAH